MKSRNSGIHKDSWALLASRESKANGIPRKNPQHRTGSLACCCFLPARGNRAMAEPWLWFRYAIQQPLTVTQKGQRAGLSQEGKRGFNKFGEERKGILEGRTDRVHLSSIYQNYSQILGSTLWYFRAIGHCYVISMWQYNARSWTTHCTWVASP